MNRLTDEELVAKCISEFPFALYTKEESIITEKMLNLLSESRKGMWKDEDMLNAWDAKNEYKLKTGSIDHRSFHEWLDQYRKERKDE